MAEPPFGHEPSTIAVPRVLGVGAILALTVIVVVILVRIVLGRWVIPQHEEVVSRSAAIPAPPRLQAHPPVDLEALRSQKQTLLSTWAWTGPTRQFARIPLERAMALYLQRQQSATDGSAGRAPATAKAAP